MRAVALRPRDSERLAYRVQDPLDPRGCRGRLVVRLLVQKLDPRAVPPRDRPENPGGHDQHRVHVGVIHRGGRRFERHRGHAGHRREAVGEERQRGPTDHAHAHLEGLRLLALFHVHPGDEEEHRRVEKKREHEYREDRPPVPERVDHLFPEHREHFTAHRRRSPRSRRRRLRASSDWISAAATPRTPARGFARAR